MNQKRRRNLLGIYDLFLAFCAFYLGILMLRSSTGIFSEYPEEWLSKVPFHNWFIPGIIAIIVFGFGNTLAAIFSFRKGTNKPWLLSAIMGGIFFIGLIIQIVVLRETYLATMEALVLSLVQLCLSGYSFTSYYRNRKMVNIS